MGQRLSEADLVHGVQERGHTALFIPTVETECGAPAPTLQTGDRVIILSNGVSAASTPDCCRARGCARDNPSEAPSSARSSESSVRLKLKQAYR